MAPGLEYGPIVAPTVGTIGQAVRISAQMLHRAGIALRYHLHRLPPRPFFLLFTQRSGSNLLASYLNGLRGVQCLGEVLHLRRSYGLPRTGLPRRVVLRHLRHSLSVSGATHAGARIALEHLQRHRLAVTDLLSAFPAAGLVLLYRQSLADQYVSLCLAHLTRRWVFTPRHLRRGRAAAETARIRLDRQLFLGYAEQIRAMYREALHQVVRARIVVVSYEDLVGDGQHLVDTVLAPLLGVASRPIQTYFLKQNTRALSEVVENFDEVRDLWEDPAHRQTYGSGPPVYAATIPAGA